MSNEYKDWISDRWTGFEANTSMLNYLPAGWVKSFVPQMQKEIFNALGSYSDCFVIIQAKEKYGELRVYWQWDDKDYTNDEIHDLNELYPVIESILDRYNDISVNTCVNCGNTATHINKKYMLPFCDNCNKN